MLGDISDISLIKPVLIACKANGGLVCPRALASSEGVRVESILDVLRWLEAYGVVEAAASEIPGLLRVTWGETALRAIFLFALNVPGLDEGGDLAPPSSIPAPGVDWSRWLQ